MKRTLFAVITLFAAHAASCAQDRFCFDMQLGKRTIKVQMVLDDKWETGHVQYQGQKGTIPIKFKHYKTLEDNHGQGSPNEVQYDFEEIIDGKVTGMYSLIVQGIPRAASYLRYRDKKEFDMDFDAIEEDCLMQE